MSKILLAGGDSRLLETRAAVLAKTGASVACYSAAKALEILDEETFDLVVLCHSLSDPDVALVVEKVRKKVPDTKILVVASNADRYGLPRENKVDATTLPEPERLVALAKELLQATHFASVGADAQGGLGHLHRAGD
jgi:CheY-like chemotaxis protein